MIITLNQVAVFFLIFARMIGLFQFAPVFNDRQIMAMGKITLTFWTTLIFIFIIPLPLHLPATPMAFTLALLAEFLIGVLIGFTTQLLLIGVEFAGSLMDTQAGISVAAQLDPAYGHSTTLLAKLMRWLAVIIFLYLNGHHMLLIILHRSFEIIPIASNAHIDLAAKFLVSLGVSIFAVAVQFSIAIMLVMFLVDFMFGILNKIAPQVNVFSLGFQIKPIIAIFIFMVIVPGLVYQITELIKQIAENVMRLFIVIQP